MINYFDFYGIPVKFNLDERELRSRYFRLLKDNHPDLFAHQPGRQEETLLNSSRINEAYKTLSDFHRRAWHILELHGWKEDGKLPAEFLMEMMDINLAVEEASPQNNPQEWAELVSRMDASEAGLIRELQELSGEADRCQAASDMPLKAIQENLLKHKYILRLKETMANIAAP